MTEYLTYRCNECGSDNVEYSAYVQWDLGSQRWEIYEQVDDSGYCFKCGSYTDINEEVVTSLKEIAQITIAQQERNHDISNG